MGPTRRSSTYEKKYASPLPSLRPRPRRGASRVIDCGAIGGWAGETNTLGWAGETNPLGWAGEKTGLCEHPAGVLLSFVIARCSGFRKGFQRPGRRNSHQPGASHIHRLPTILRALHRRKGGLIKTSHLPFLSTQLGLENYADTPE